MAQGYKPPPHLVALTDADKAVITARAEAGESANSIAVAMGKDKGTVQWFMYRQGLAVPVKRAEHVTGRVTRNGRKPYTAAEDDFITAARVEGHGLTVIARMATEAFGHPRNPHSIYCRLTMLANVEESA